MVPILEAVNGLNPVLRDLWPANRYGEVEKMSVELKQNLNDLQQKLLNLRGYL